MSIRLEWLANLFFQPHSGLYTISNFLRPFPQTIQYLQFPLVYDDAVQWSPNYSSSGSGPPWENLHIPLNYRRRWLCVSQKLECTDSQNSTQVHKL